MKTLSVLYAHAADLVAFAGAALVISGVSFIYYPAGLIVAGFFMLALAYGLQRVEK